MNSLIVFSLLVATSMAQTFYAPSFGYPGVTPYANAYAPGIEAANFIAPRTAFDVFRPAAFYNNYPFALNPYYNHLGLNVLNEAPVAIAPATEEIAIVDEADAVEVKPALKLSESTEEEAEVEVIEADASPIVAKGPIEIRRIFPVFASDLRGAITNVDFLRPEQVRPIKPVDEDDDVSIVVPQFKSLFPSFATQFRRF